MIVLEDKGMNMVSAILLIVKVMIVKEGTMIMEEVIDLAVFLDKDTEDALHLKEAMKITTDYLGKEIIEIGEKMKGGEITIGQDVVVLSRGVLLQVQIHLRIDV